MLSWVVNNRRALQEIAMDFREMDSMGGKKIKSERQNYFYLSGSDIC